MFHLSFREGGGSCGEGVRAGGGDIDYVRFERLGCGCAV